MTSETEAQARARRQALPGLAGLLAGAAGEGGVMITEDTQCPEGFPPHIWDGTRDCVLHGLRPGGFMLAVVRNDLFEAFGRANRHSAAVLQRVVQWFYNEAPTACWGSVEKVDMWIEIGGLKGLLEGRGT